MLYLPIVMLLLFVLMLCSPMLTYISDNSIYSLKVPEVLRGYIEYGYDNNGIPNGSPFGSDNSYIITAGYHDPDYLRTYRRVHEAVDIIPSSNYYSNNGGYQLLHQVVLYATCNGTAYSFQDSSNANYIHIVCEGEKYSVLYVHNKFNFIDHNEKAEVKAGYPLGIMGDTGNAFGEHVHYAIKDLSKRKYIDPVDFMD